MPNHSVRYGTWLCALMAFSAGGCNDAPSSEPLSRIGADEDVAVADGTPFKGAAAAEPPAAPPIIYYQLTMQTWYMQGQPLRFGGAEYFPRDELLEAVPGQMRPVGEYRGVDVYASSRARPPYATVFVPVFPGYWQPFARGSSAKALHAD